MSNKLTKSTNSIKSTKSTKQTKQTNAVLSNQQLKKPESSCISTLTKDHYAKLDNWCDYFNSGKDLMNVKYDLSWVIMFSKLMKNPKYARLNDKLKELVQKDNKLKIYPLPSHLMASFMITKASDLKVVFIGQDPYFNCEYSGTNYVPQAMGLSFSVPTGINIPSSLANIFRNMIKYGHLKKMPTDGNLWFWAAQGCLMLNAALTVEDGTKEAHLRMWEWFTDYVIQYISQNFDDIIFVLWGAYAYKKISMIDLDRHHTIVSSHPSGLSANKPFQDYPAFMNEDTFGKINNTLNRLGKTRIMWR